MNLSDPDQLFRLVSSLALLGWIWLLIALFSPQRIFIRTKLFGLVVPTILSLFYTGSILVFFADAEGGFNSLESVMLLFDTHGATLAGWIHFLAFDLLVGWWIVLDVRKLALNRMLTVPVLFFIFHFGPIGILLYGLHRLAYWVVNGNSQKKSP